MPDSPLADSVAMLRGVIQLIDTKLATGNLPPEGLTDLKSAVDDLRLKLWALLVADDSQDYQAYRRRFRLQRAREICRTVVADLRDETPSWTQAEVADLTAVVQELAMRLARGPQPEMGTSPEPPPHLGREE